MMKKLNISFLTTFILIVVSACSDPFMEICAEYETAIADLDAARERLNLASERINNLRDSYAAQGDFLQDPDNPISAELEIARTEYKSLEANLEFAEDIAQQATESYNAALSAEDKPACVKRHAEAACESAKTAKAKYKTDLEVSPVEILRTAKTEYDTLQSQFDAAQTNLEVKLETDYNAAIRNLAGFAKTEYEETKAQYDAATTEFEAARTRLDTIVKAKETDVAKAEAKVATVIAEYDAAKAESAKAANDAKARVSAIHKSVQSKYRTALQGLEARFRAKEVAARAKFDSASLKEEQMQKTHGRFSAQRKNATREKNYFEGEWRTARDAYSAAKRAVERNDHDRLTLRDAKYEADIKAANAEIEAARELQTESAGTDLSTIEAKLDEAEADLAAVRANISDDTEAVEQEVEDARARLMTAQGTYLKLDKDIQQTVITDNALLVQDVDSLNNKLQKAKDKYETLRNNPRSAADAAKEAYFAARDLAKQYAVTHGYADNMSMPCW